MNIIDKQYKEVVQTVLDNGIEVQGRNGTTITVPAISFTYDLSTGRFPIISSRKIFYKGVLGEYAALLNGVSCVDDFKKYGCNYYKAQHQKQ